MGGKASLSDFAGVECRCAQTARAMRALVGAASLILSFGMAGCRATAAVTPQRSSMGWIELSQDRRSFVESRGERPWAPWGYNYVNDASPAMRLIEDYWDGEWSRVVRDFREMRSMGARVVRVHLQLPRFMKGPTSVDEGALVQLRRLVLLAEEEGLRLDITGLCNYRSADVPAWYDALPEAERWAAQALFWEAVASRVADSPAVFCYDLMNEPGVPGAEPQAAWRPPPWIDGRTYPEWLVRDLGGRSRADVGRRWLRTMIAAIRRHDARHLVTVGSFLLFDQAHDLPIGLTAEELAPEVDFLSVHLYPHTGRLDVARKELEQLSVGKPLFVEESGPVECTPDDLRQLMEGSRGKVAGWMGFFTGKTVAELRRSGDLRDGIWAEWLEMFRREQRELGGP